MKLSILIPVYNEEKTIGDVIEQVLQIDLGKVEREVIVVDDGSTDNTKDVIKKYVKKGTVVSMILHGKNKGKGAAIRTAIAQANGDYIIIQDADLEYDPKDIKKLIDPIVSGKARVVYGTRLKRLPRFSRDERTFRFFLHYVGNKGLSFITSLLYGQWITDMETGYKVIPRKVFKEFSLNASGFDFEPEITAKLLKNRYTIYEVPISTNPRGYADGKKLNTVSDGIKALLTLIRYRF